MRNKYTLEQIEFIKNNVNNRVKDLTLLFNEKFNSNLKEYQIASIKSKYNLKSGIKTPVNKGKKQEEYMTKEQIEKCKKTQFKKGHSLNEKPIGTEKIKNGFVYIKIAPKTWKPKHFWVWEQTHEKIKENQCLMFLDGNKLNCSLENLKLISKKEMLILNLNKMYYSNKESNESALLIVKIMDKIKKQKL